MGLADEIVNLAFGLLLGAIAGQRPWPSVWAGETLLPVN